MEKNEFEDKVKELADMFYKAMAELEPCKVSYGFQKVDRCKNFAFIDLKTSSGLAQRYEVWEPHSGGVKWDVKDLGFGGAFV